MAEFHADGIDGLILSLQELASIPEEVQDAMLNAGADVLVPVQRAKVKRYGIYDMSNVETRHVADSIKKGKPKNKRGGGRVIYVTATGSRRRGNTTTRNAEILFVNEFGRRNQKGRPAIRDSTEEAADAVAAAEQEVWNQHLADLKL